MPAIAIDHLAAKTTTGLALILCLTVSGSAAHIHQPSLEEVLAENQCGDAPAPPFGRPSGDR